MATHPHRPHTEPPKRDARALYFDEVTAAAIGLVGWLAAWGWALANPDIGPSWWRWTPPMGLAIGALWMLDALRRRN